MCSSDLIASRVSRCSVLTEDLPSVWLVWQRSRLARPYRSGARFPAEKRATIRLAARLVRRPHPITVISAAEALTTGLTMDVGECAEQAAEQSPRIQGDSPIRETPDPRNHRIVVRAAHHDAH